MSDKEFIKRFPTRFDPVIYAEVKRVKMRQTAMYFGFGFMAVTTLILFVLIALVGANVLHLPESLLLSLGTGTVIQMGSSVVIIYRFLFSKEK